MYHPLCLEDMDAPLPTRVIDFGDATPGSTLYVPPLRTRGHYVALSYCGGECQKLTWTRYRLKRLGVRFPVKTLP